MIEDVAGTTFPARMARSFVLGNITARARAIQCVTDAPDGWCVSVKEPRRNLEQNALMWELLEKFSNQLLWPVNGEMSRLSPEEWKDVLSAAFNREAVRLAQGLNGGIVLLGMRTSRMSKRRFSEFIEFIHAIAAEKEIDLATS